MQDDKNKELNLILEEELLEYVVEAKRVDAFKWICPKCSVVNYEPINDLELGNDVRCISCKRYFIIKNYDNKLL